MLLVNLKEVIGKLQAERNYFKTQVEKLLIEKKQLIVSKQNLSKKVKFLEKELKTTTTLLVWDCAILYSICLNKISNVEFFIKTSDLVVYVLSFSYNS